MDHSSQKIVADSAVVVAAAVAVVGVGVAVVSDEFSVASLLGKGRY